MHFSSACIAAAAVFLCHTQALPASLPKRDEIPGQSGNTGEPLVEGQGAPGDIVEPGKNPVSPSGSMFPNNPALTYDQLLKMFPFFPKNPGTTNSLPGGQLMSGPLMPGQKGSNLEGLLGTGPNGNQPAPEQPTPNEERPGEGSEEPVPAPEAPSSDTAKNGRRSLNLAETVHQGPDSQPQTPEEPAPASESSGPEGPEQPESEIPSDSTGEPAGDAESAPGGPEQSPDSEQPEKPKGGPEPSPEAPSPDTDGSEGPEGDSTKI